MDAEAWLEQSLIDREEWSAPAARRMAAERRALEAASNTVAAYSQRYVRERDLRLTAAARYTGLPRTRMLPYFGRCRCAT
ncbi:hypothetical protein [Pimelobacter simplex]|uniref:hypothetical protein n=1 Tax=Nocardioides simplex TaxID=2045 RepID=UPI00214FF326|nr:hypothetical protein [Pimelobacter simplex]UUW90914.1 hypothetical protein M0M43_05345 [Pimelobacter simplex]UUW94743.1 hypothetical protein M0M48_23850 [Pimelobacter simplex]